MNQKRCLLKLMCDKYASWGSFHAHWSRSLFRNSCFLGPDWTRIGLHTTNSVCFFQNHLVSHPLLHVPKDILALNSCFSTVISQPKPHGWCVCRYRQRMMVCAWISTENGIKHTILKKEKKRNMEL